MLRAMSETSTQIQAPVSGKARIRSIDTLRGLVLLGILIINILAFAQPFGAMADPQVDGAVSGVDFALFAGAEIFVEGGMRAVFSMLFGAGLLIFMNKPGADPAEVRSLYYRRTGWLIVFGLVNAYLLLMLAGFGVGLPLNAWETMTFVGSGYDIQWQSLNRPSYDLGRLALAVGYIGLVMSVCRAGLLRGMQSVLARIGQMALTNYLMQTVLCNLVFLGFGLGRFALWDRWQMYLFVLGVWILQALFSVYWLDRYRFGPCEWLWRSLTYRRRQPMLKPA